VLSDLQGSAADLAVTRQEHFTSLQYKLKAERRSRRLIVITRGVPVLNIEGQSPHRTRTNRGQYIGRHRLQSS
jgi:hypothetical protein